MENKYKTKEITFSRCIDGCDLTQFIEDNSDKDWNTICDIENKIQLYGDEGGTIGYILYEDEGSIYHNHTDQNEIWYQEMINKFYEAYNLDKNESITILFIK